MDDERTLSEYNNKVAATLQLTSRLREGGYRVNELDVEQHQEREADTGYFCYSFEPGLRYGGVCNDHACKAYKQPMTMKDDLVKKLDHFLRKKLKRILDVLDVKHHLD